MFQKGMTDMLTEFIKRVLKEEINKHTLESSIRTIEEHMNSNGILIRYEALDALKRLLDAFEVSLSNMESFLDYDLIKVKHIKNARKYLSHGIQNVGQMCRLAKREKRSTEKYAVDLKGNATSKSKVIKLCEKMLELEIKITRLRSYDTLKDYIGSDKAMRVYALGEGVHQVCNSFSDLLRIFPGLEYNFNIIGPLMSSVGKELKEI